MIPVSKRARTLAQWIRLREADLVAMNGKQGCQKPRVIGVQICSTNLLPFFWRWFRYGEVVFHGVGIVLSASSLRDA